MTHQAQGLKQLEGGDGSEQAAGLGVSKIEGGDGCEHAKVGEMQNTACGTDEGNAERATDKESQAQGLKQLEGGEGYEMAAGLGMEKPEGGDGKVDMGVSMAADPSGALAENYMSRPQDSERLDREEQVLLRLSKDYNKSWKKECNAEWDKDEVRIFGDVILSEDELNLLNLGPGFMVVSELDPMEMQIATICTQIRNKTMRNTMARAVAQDIVFP